jgi:hypothetical protein
MYEVGNAGQFTDIFRGGRRVNSADDAMLKTMPEKTPLMPYFECDRHPGRGKCDKRIGSIDSRRIYDGDFGRDVVGGNKP